MKKLLLILSLCSGVYSMAMASDAYTIDPMHSYVGYHINHLDFSNQSGKWFVNGTLDIDSAKMQKSSVNIQIKIDDLVTGIPKLDKHLKTTDFFDIAKYPTATFVSSKASAVNNKKFKVEGMLTLHGVSKPVTLMVIENKQAINPMSKIQTAGFSAMTTIRRSDFGMMAYIPAISDEVRLDIEVEAQLNSPKAQ